MDSERGVYIGRILKSSARIGIMVVGAPHDFLTRNPHLVTDHSRVTFDG